MANWAWGVPVEQWTPSSDRGSPLVLNGPPRPLFATPDDLHEPQARASACVKGVPHRCMGDAPAAIVQRQ